MTHSKQSAKRVRQSEARRKANRSSRTRLNTDVKRVLTAATRDEARKLLPAATSLLDKAAKQRLIHPNAASRQKSRLARVIASKPA